MTRTAAREIAVRLVFALDCNGQEAGSFLDGFFDGEYYATLSGEDKLFAQLPDEQLSYIRALVSGAYARGSELDGLIEKYSKGWKLTRISRVAAAILRVALYEVLYMEEVPPRAAINEAVELSKSYEEQETAAFINGILGSFMREKFDEEPEADATERSSEQPVEEPEAQ
ncbi:MAG: transcription antitermination factor NusB [Oscillospiraceae bacterium]|jgi:N utilization substance protein B|nr:transcription antitermination factor NusB [Oscillospiraceae bacterium]